MKSIFSIAFLFIASMSIAQMDDKFYFPIKEWKSIDSVNFEEINFKLKEVTINSILLKPLSQSKATILYFHGAGGNVSYYVELVKPLVEDGFQVLMIDSRGYGKSTGTPTHLGIAKDAQLVFDNIQKDKRFKKSKIIVYGASMGTQVAANLASKNNTEIVGLVLDGCIASFTEIAKTSAPVEQHAMIEKFIVSPYSPLEDVKNLGNCPLLMIHSKEDADVPYSHFEMVFGNVETTKKEWIYVGGHLEAPLIFKDDFLERINQFLN